MNIFENYKQQIRTIAHLGDTACEQLKECLKVKRYRKNDYLIREGQVSREIGFVSEGLFRMFYLMDGKEVNMHFFFENAFVVPYQSFLTQQPTRNYIQALEDAEVISFSFDDLQKAYHDSHEWERFGRVVAENSFIHTTERVESFLFLSGEQRYLELMNHQPEILDRVPLYHIASYLGIERESLSRIRRKILQG
jgi:CRP/FNR family transcriptional regulator, anaerobic regulatory protein